MTAYYSKDDHTCYSQVSMNTQRLRDQPYYLSTLSISTAHGMDAAYPQALSVVDDFGDLVIVRAWR